MSPAPRRFPFPLPSGWFRVGFADELEPGQVAPLRYFGRDLVRMCTANGGVRVFDAHCPHLGAHLGHGGRVEGDVLRCPFHGWGFAPDGSCVDVPYARHRPPGARLRPWPTLLRNGIVWAWHGPDGQAPSWEVPEIAEVEDPGWSPLVHHRWRVRTRNQEIAENTSDPAHFAVVHGFAGVPCPEIRFDGPRYRSFSAYRAPNTQGELIDSTLEVVWHGLGIGVTRSTGSLELLFIGTITPVDEEQVEACFSFSVCREKGLDPESGLGRASIVEAIRQMDQDIPIWENKRYRARPLLCDEDGPIGSFRQWARQFYPDASAA
ncbi:MAG: Rieske 2Fe-2S domain-containing protein [Myxococcota bacterium]|nr:Rieske 2Fe-2S domain-containing protein [Myxococcota bacterium]